MWPALNEIERRSCIWGPAGHWPTLNFPNIVFEPEPNIVLETKATTVLETVPSYSPEKPSHWNKRLLYYSNQKLPSFLEKELPLYEPFGAKNENLRGNMKLVANRG